MSPVSHGSAPLKTRGAYVYQIVDSQGEVLYVGLTNDICSRMAGHRQKRADWWRLAVRVEFDEYSTRREAARVEAKLIHQLQPEGNTALRGDPFRRTLKKWDTASLAELEELRLQVSLPEYLQECHCEFDFPEEDGEESWHYTRNCSICKTTWGGLHCVHDGTQNACPGCGWLGPEHHTPIEALFGDVWKIQ